MNRYYFGTKHGGNEYHDEEGINLPSIEVATKQMLALIDDITYGSQSGSAVIAQVRCGDRVVLVEHRSLILDVCA